MTQSAAIKREIVYRRPVEVVDSAFPSPLRSVSESIGVAVIVMFLLGSTGLLDWANGLPVGTTIGDTLSNLAQRWNDADDLSTPDSVRRTVASNLASSSKPIVTKNPLSARSLETAKSDAGPIAT